MVTYGNLRWEVHSWGEGEDLTLVFSLVYETPGGSTSQRSVYYRPESGMFEALGGEEGQDIRTSAYGEVVDWLEKLVRRIPSIRLEKLKHDIEQWFAEGRSRMEILQEMNKLLQTDFKGGSITHTELREGIMHLISLMEKKSR